MTTAHRQTADGAVPLVLGHLVVALHILHDVHEALIHRGDGLLVDAAHKRGLVHATRPLAGSSLAVGIAVRHHHNHRLGLARGNQVVQYLCGATQFTPGILVATGTVHQVHHGVVLALVVACRGVDGHAALHLQRGAVIPHLGQITMPHFIHAIEVALVTLRLADDEDIGE